MASLAPLLNKFLCLFIFLVHLSCFYVFSAKAHTQQQNGFPTKKRKLPQTSRKAISSSWSYIKRMFSCKNTTKTQPESSSLTSARSSHNSLVNLVPLDTHHLSDPPRKKPSGLSPEFDILSDPQFFPLRNDIFPCTACGEIFPKGQMLEQHQAIKHAVSELIDGDSGKNIVRIIFKTGWSCEKSPIIQRILKIHNGAKIISRFEEYREAVKAKALHARRRDERCIADGNELLRFHCSTFICDLGLNGNSGICTQQYCSICGVIRAGFSPKMDGISTLSTSLRAHMAVPDDIEEEFKFMNVKRAMLVCRVIAGRVGCDTDEVDKEDVDGYDSVLGRGGSGVHVRLDEEELLVFSPRAVLPCFVIVYSV